MTGGLWLVAGATGRWPSRLRRRQPSLSGEKFYDSLLPGVASEKRVDYASSLGLGSPGGGPPLPPEHPDVPQTRAVRDRQRADGDRLAFSSVALWWAIFSLPVFLFVREPAVGEIRPLGRAFALGWRQLAAAPSGASEWSVCSLLAYWLYIDGVIGPPDGRRFRYVLGFPASALVAAL